MGIWPPWPLVPPGSQRRATACTCSPLGRNRRALSPHPKRTDAAVGLAQCQMTHGCHTDDAQMTHSEQRTGTESAGEDILPLKAVSRRGRCSLALVRTCPRPKSMLMRQSGVGNATHRRLPFPMETSRRYYSLQDCRERWYFIKCHPTIKKILLLVTSA